MVLDVTSVMSEDKINIGRKIFVTLHLKKETKNRFEATNENVTLNKNSKRGSFFCRTFASMVQ